MRYIVQWCHIYHRSLLCIQVIETICILYHSSIEKTTYVGFLYCYRIILTVRYLLIERERIVINAEVKITTFSGYIDNPGIILSVNPIYLLDLLAFITGYCLYAMQLVEVEVSCI